MRRDDKSRGKEEKSEEEMRGQKETKTKEVRSSCEYIKYELR